MSYFSGGLEITSDAVGPGNLSIYNNLIIYGATANKTTVISNAIEDIIIELPNISDKLIGTQTTDILYNKTIIDSSNTIFANGFIDSAGNMISASLNNPSDAGYMLISVSPSDTEWRLFTDVAGYLSSDITAINTNISNINTNIININSDLYNVNTNIIALNSDVDYLLNN